MATSGAAEAAAENDKDPKRNLWRLVRLITDNNDGRLDTFDEAARALEELKNLTVGWPAVPQHLLCPLSSELMSDPVIVTSGQTFDRPYIQEWLHPDNRTCPLTHHVLSLPRLTPNILIRTLISEWCLENGIPLPEPVSLDEVVVPRKDVKEVYDLVHKVSSSTSISEQKEAVKELRLLTGRNRFSLAIIGEKPDTIPRLLSALCLPRLNGDPEFQEDAVTAILNISKYEDNKKIIGDYPLAVPFLIDALKNGTMEVRRNAAGTLFNLSALDSMKFKIGALKAIKPLVELLEQGSQPAKRDAGAAIFNICSVRDNMARALKAGVVGVALKAIMDESLVDQSLGILALFRGYNEAMEEVRNSGGVPYLLRIARESIREASKENAAMVLLRACKKDKAMCRVVREEEDSYKTFTRLMKYGRRRVRKIAAKLLRKVDRMILG